jgi:hypothetical protein
MSILSVHSRRTVHTKRSATELAQRACGGVLITSIPAAMNTVSKTGGELGVAIVEQEPKPGRALVEVHQQVTRLLSNPGAGWMGRHPDHMDLTGGDLDEKQHIDPLEQDGVHGEGVTRISTSLAHRRGRALGGCCRTVSQQLDRCAA